MEKHARKSGHKKLLQQEKAKVKFKVSHKTVLPKGQNVTNTNFKVKKIIIKEQLKERSGDEIVSKKNLNIKALLTRTNHHNVSFRCGALNELIEILQTHNIGVCITYLPALIESVSKLVLDKERDVRRNAVKLLSIILSQVTDDQISPLFEIIVKYLACTMSHINADIRESSLDLLDVLVSKCIRLTSTYCYSVILPGFLDLISTKFSDSERHLTIHYNNKMTSSIWRTKVLNTLQALLEAVVQNQKLNTSGEHMKCVKTITFTDKEPLYVSLYNNQCIINIEPLDFSSTSNVDKRVPDEISSIQNNSEMLIPLLLDIFIEVAPSKKEISSGYPLNVEAANLLKSVSSVIQLMWKIYSSSDRSYYLKQWFSERFSAILVNKLVTGRFPYRYSETLVNQRSIATRKKRKRNEDTELPVGSVSESEDLHCVEQNLNLCYMYINMFQHLRNKNDLPSVVNYINETLKSCRTLPHAVVETLLTCVDGLFSSDFCRYSKKLNAASLVKMVKKLYDESVRHKDSYLASCTSEYLSRLILNRNIKRAHKEPELLSWIDELPKCLLGKEVRLEQVKIVANIARCNIPIFLDSLDGYIEAILDNIPNLNIISSEEIDKLKAKKMIVNLLCVIQTWDAEFVQNLKHAVENEYFGPLTMDVKHILESKLVENR